MMPRSRSKSWEQTIGGPCVVDDNAEATQGNLVSKTTTADLKFKAVMSSHLGIMTDMEVLQRLAQVTHVQCIFLKHSAGRMLFFQ